MDSAKNDHRDGLSLRTAFTLVELLVVVGIIALLLGILVPALAGVRANARQQACAVHLRGLSVAMVHYATDHRDYMPGPNTSGAHITGSGFSDFAQHADEPTFNADWLSPMVGRSLTLPAQRDRRLVSLFDEFQCPSNEAYYDAYVGSGLSGMSAQQVRYSSYSSPMAFHMTATSSHTPLAGSAASVLPQAPNNYRFRLNQVGTPGHKVFVMDGGLSVNNTGQRSLNAGVYQQQHIPIISMGPAFAASESGSPYTRSGNDLTDLAERHAYRHNNQLNVGLFDGSVTALSDAQSRDVDRFAPTGSTIINAAASLDPDDVNGQIIE